MYKPHIWKTKLISDPLLESKKQKSDDTEYKMK